MLTLGQMVLVYGVVQAGARGWLASAALGPMVAGLVLLGLFCVIEAKFASDPLVPFRELAKALRATNTIVVIFSAALLPMWYVSSLYLQQVLWLSPTRAGLTFLPMALTIMLVARTAGTLVGRFGVRAVLGSGLTIMAVGLLLFTRIAAERQHDRLRDGPRRVYCSWNRDVDRGLYDRAIEGAKPGQAASLQAW